MDQKQSKARIFLDPLLKANPLFVMVLGTCPALAVTRSFEAALGMGVLFTFVIFCSNLIISALRKVIPDEVRTPCYIVVIATFVTAVKILTSTFLPDLNKSLGMFVSLLVVNCIVLGRAEAFASKNTVVDSMIDGVGNGLGYTWAICAIALVREILGNGTLSFGNSLKFLPQVELPILKFGEFSAAMELFQTEAGGFLVLGVALAIIAAVTNARKEKAKAKAKAEKAAAAAAARGGNL